MRFGFCVGLAALLVSLAGIARSDATPIPPSFEIYSVGVNGAGIRNLTHSILDDHSPAVSPNGRKIAFIRTTAGNRDLWIMNADGSAQQRLTSSTEDESGPLWSPNGALIAFTAATRDRCLPGPCSPWSVRIIRPDGTSLREVVSYARNARWSPDGGRLVVETDIDPYQEAESISVARLAGGVRKIVETTGVLAHPVWSRGGRIAFLWDQGQGAALYVARADGGARRRISGAAESPEWSPSGRQLGFLTGNRLKIVAASGGRVRTIRRADGFAWSRNGRRIALFQNQGRIALVKPDGRGFRSVTRVRGTLDASWLGPWTWSRDGSRLVYAARVEQSPPG
jgi:Tol biopolymer transport system component